MPKVSVIVPVYNVEKYIGRCIESIQKQTLTDWELILVDDCSPDNSIEIIQEYEKKDSRIIVKRHDVNHGPMIARHNGCIIARGEYITFVDGDDEMIQDALERLYDKAVCENSDIVSGNIEIVDKSGNHQPFWSNSLRYGNDRKGLFESLFKRELSHNLCSKLFKRDIIHKADYEKIESFTNAEDLYFFYQIARNCNRVSILPQTVYLYHQLSTSSSHKKMTNKAIDNIIWTIKYKQQFLNEMQDLHNDIKRESTVSALELYLRKGTDRKYVETKLIESGLQMYISNVYILKYLSGINKYKTIVKKYLHF